MNPWDLQRPLVFLTPHDPLTLGQCTQGTFISGATGSAKSSGPARLLFQSFLENNFGGLVCTVKKDEVDVFRKYARAARREQDVVVLSPDSGNVCDLLRYEMLRPGPGAGQTENLARFLMELVSVTDGGGGDGRDHDGGFWKLAAGRLCRNGIEIVKAGQRTVTLADLDEVIRSAPQSPAELSSETWRAQSACFRWILAGESRSDLPEGQRRDFEHAARFFLQDWASLAERTRSVVGATLSGLLDQFQRGVLRDLFCSGETNVIPEMCYASRNGRAAIIILDLPLKEWGEVGRIGQIAFRLLWQRAMERRDVTRFPRPVFLALDECQHFLSAEDALFLSTARAARVCAVLISQNLPAIYRSFGGGESGKHAAETVLANCTNRIFLANSCPISNTYAADLFSKKWIPKIQVGSGGAPTQEAYHIRRNLQNHTTNASVSEVMEYSVLPGEFTTLKCGGPPDFVCEGYVFQSGRRWSHGGNALRVLFPQS